MTYIKKTVFLHPEKDKDILDILEGKVFSSYIKDIIRMSNKNEVVVSMDTLLKLINNTTPEPER